MKNRTLIKMTALLIALLMIMSLTACGGSNGDDEESNSQPEEQTQEMDSENDAGSAAGVTEQEDNGPKEVSAFDMNTTYEYHGTDYDDEEGYDREFSSVNTESSKLVEYKVFPSKEYSSCIVVLHFNNTLDLKRFDAQGNETEPTGAEDLYLSFFLDNHLVPNVDTGETEDLWDYDSAYGEDIMSYEADYEGLGDYLREEGYDPYANADLYDDDDTYGIKPYSNRDFYYFYRVEHGKGTLEFHMKNNALEEGDLTVTSYNDAEQIMKIEL